MATTDMNAQIHIKDGNGNVNNIFPATKIANVEGLTSALNAKADTTTVNNQLSGKVDKETGKGLSTNDYTTAEKNKLAGIAAGATAVTVDSTLSESSTNAIQNKAVKTALDVKADASTVSSLSSQVSTNTTNIATQTARIDSIASLPSGSTSGDAELMDIRVKADGTTASSAGDAVREQVESITNDLKDAQLYDTNNLLFGATFSKSGNYYVAEVNPNADSLSVSVALHDSSVSASGLSLGVGNGSSISLWMIYEGAISVESRTTRNKYIMVHPANENTLAVLKQKFNIMVNTGDPIPYEGKTIKVKNMIQNAIESSGHIKDYGTVSSGNYSSVLPDLDDAPNDSVYVINVSANANRPAHMPSDTDVYFCSMLFTFGGEYKTQLLIDQKYMFKRTNAGNGYGDWVQVNNLDDCIKDYGTVSSGNYSSVLPDLDDAPNDSVYVINVSANANRPAHMPSDTDVYFCSMLFTFGGEYKTQLLIDQRYMFKRTNAGNGYSDWTIVKEQNSVTANPSNLISVLKKYNGSGMKVVLSAGTYDIYQMYIDYYGSDYWTNYSGYVGNPDPFSNGIWVDNVELVGAGDVSFIFSGTTTQAIMDYFSFFAPTGGAILRDFRADVGVDKVRYCIHDDYAVTGSRIIYENLIISGSPYQGALIGAGFQDGCSYEITNCVFLNNEKNHDISYHSAGNAVNPCKITISNCYGTKDIIFRWYGNLHKDNQCVVNNCKFRKIYKIAHIFTPNDYDNINLIKYMCEESES